VKSAEGVAEATSKMSRLVRGFGNGMKTFFSPKVQVPLAAALEVLVLLDAMDMASGALRGEGFILRAEIKQTEQIEKGARDLLTWYEGYHDDLARAVSDATLLILLTGSKEARATMQQQAPEILEPLRARAREVDNLSRKVGSIRREADEKARIAEKLLNSREFAILTAPTGTVTLAKVFAAMEDLIRIRGAASTAERDLEKLTQLIQEDIEIMSAFL
jgi:hypothetical protein